MITQIEREELAKILLRTDDETLINQVKDLLLMKGNTWANLPDAIKGDITTSIQELESGLGIPHHEVMKNYKKWL